jgi:hypothetical protein
MPALCGLAKDMHLLKVWGYLGFAPNNLPQLEEYAKFAPQPKTDLFYALCDQNEANFD